MNTWSGTSIMLPLKFKQAKWLLLSYHTIGICHCILPLFFFNLFFFFCQYKPIRLFCAPCVPNNDILSPNLCAQECTRENSQGLKFQGNIFLGEVKKVRWQTLLKYLPWVTFQLGIICSQASLWVTCKQLVFQTCLVAHSVPLPSILN